MKILTIDLFNKRITCSHCGMPSNASVGIQECPDCYERYCDTPTCAGAHRQACEKSPTPGMQQAHDQLWNEPELPVTFERGRDFEAEGQLES